MLHPRPYQDWIDYDQAMLRLYDCCLRLDAEISEKAYRQSESAGADGEVAAFRELGKPVFFSIENLYKWVLTRKA
jgi:hypothetical protein